MNNKRITITREEIITDFITPPEHGGQIVTVEYACTEELILERTRDASARKETVVAYRLPSFGEFAPWNGRPALGARVGTVVIR